MEESIKNCEFSAEHLKKLLTQQSTLIKLLSRLKPERVKKIKISFSTASQLLTVRKQIFFFLFLRGQNFYLYRPWTVDNTVPREKNLRIRILYVIIGSSDLNQISEQSLISLKYEIFRSF